jgi:oxygen-independent coproporphyrinogen-3 oxidase
MTANDTATAPMTDLARRLAESPYQGYAYAYPHKTAYRRLDPPVPLAEAWAGEPDRGRLLLYVHVPFCSMRCGFCNLFTQARPRAGFARSYLDALRRQAGRVRAALDDAGGAGFSRLSLGGGTPTYLEAGLLDELFDIAASVMRGPSGAVPSVPTCVEVSPDTVDADRLAVLTARGTTRVSLGVQSFIEAETAAAGRPQSAAEVRRALGRLRDAGIPVLNIDLMYGLPGQTPQSWSVSLDAALEFRPEEVYLYPTYVRPLTGLGESRRRWDDLRLALYRQGRDRLRSAGYRQASMRFFRRADAPPETGADGRPAPPYRCQDDGLVGLGCGARSYTRRLHYSDEYAVRQGAVGDILSRWVALPDAAFGSAGHGFRLDDAEQRRRWVVQSLLSDEGVSATEYRRRFGTDVSADLPELAELADLGLASSDADGLRLTDAGMERSDVIGPWLNSPRVRELMGDYSCR